MARKDEYYDYLKNQLTEETVGKYFSHVFEDGKWEGNIIRFECMKLISNKNFHFVISVQIFSVV